MTIKFAALVFVCLAVSLVDAAPDGDAGAELSLESLQKETQLAISSLTADVRENTRKLEDVEQHIKDLINNLDSGQAPGNKPGSTSETATSKKKASDITADYGSGMDFIGGFLTSISMIIVSEIGDKTFFIAAIMAMRHNKFQVFASAISALAVMTILSAALGFALPNLLPKKYTHWIATGLFVFFGLKLLKEAYEGEEGGMAEEKEEVQTELQAAKTEMEADVESGERKTRSVMRTFFSPVFIQCFTMTFLAEWGDRSQIATIALAAHKDPIGVTAGGIIGHSMCTGLAVLGGAVLEQSISERVVSLVGGLLFIVFAVHNYWVGPEVNML
mmetsp:Transcript_40588/g.79636  ORF Transcript_40588/g.79636 Transcript_40588/m.79636 type:complete len:331 (+) Transcript_40588:18-1010(+)|eukprot:CAMPEP_0175138320 /NCGR_PEP_ID=MMETSP0087-20121206/10284_1 /TAXON_ID=136419 /ORGANISM="Unknown Unknown, Strain D1" /LENGTH=330 /DNA_ID=CAMNT_0016421211 /DNA_START=18 /DNA_END=1010 /DNA_ORIENTATION=+